MNFDELQNKHIQLINEKNSEEIPFEGCSSSDRCVVDMAGCPQVDECTLDYSC